MTAEQKIKYIEKQMRANVETRQNTLNCPYCNEHLIPGEKICCRMFGRAVSAILMRWDLKEAAERVEQIMEKASRN